MVSGFDERGTPVGEGASLYLSSGNVVKFGPTKDLGRSYGPTVQGLLEVRTHTAPRKVLCS